MSFCGRSDRYRKPIRRNNKVIMLADVSCIGFGWVGSGWVRIFPLVVGWVGLVSQLTGWVGSVHTNWTRGQL